MLSVSRLMSKEVRIKMHPDCFVHCPYVTSELIIHLLAFHVLLRFEGGCNGYSYTMNYANIEDVNSKKDEVVVANDVTVLVDPKAVFFIAGTVMDFEVGQSEFKITSHSSGLI